MEYIKTIKQFFKNDIYNTLTMAFYVLVVSLLFIVPNKAYASDFQMTDYVIGYKDWRGGSHKSMHIYYGDAHNKKHIVEPFINTTSPFDFRHSGGCDDSDSSCSIQTSIFGRGSYLHNSYTIQNCADSDLDILQIPTGYLYEGSYICTYKGYGIDPTNPNPEPDNGIYTPEQFDEFFCGNSAIKDKLSYAYYEHSKVIDYSVRRSLGSSAVLGGDPNDDTLNLYICGSDGCTYEQLLEDARKVIKFLPEERFFAKSSDYGGYYDFEVFAYCKSAVKQVSTSDLTADTSVDCRKAIYQYTGESGSSLNSLPESSCYVDDNYDYTFKQWCEAQFDQGSYWLEGQLEEYCDPPAKQVSSEKVEKDDECKITTTVIDVGYNTSQVQDDVKKTIIKKIVVTDCTGKVISEEVIETEIDIDKGDIMGDGSDDGSDRPCVVGPYCPPTHGTGEGSGSGKGEGSGSGSGSGTDWGEAGTPDLDGWYTPIYTEGFQGVLNKHIQGFNDGGIGAFLASLNPFKKDGDFPELKLNFDFDIVDFGEHKIDLENLPIGENNFNLIELIRIILLMNASFYAFRQIF
ncbi:hypothetical protein [Photobacterium profundum]|uniref:Uncharacterized protein n=1 Tax=Photobacterium profundum 3TCK TaxID=314280 RepID=Q1Z4Y1_9GAMM|nr:hypothetical protein [Photobacterium profundum]EAS43490.1 hypothetical protein P3TCK_01499 [Photobacterium profundum 3TCK]